MPSENTAGLNVLTRYGSVPIADFAAGDIKTDGTIYQAAIEFSGGNILDRAEPGGVGGTAVIPAGSLITKGWFELEEEFVPNGDNIVVGTNGSESTNNIDFSAVDLEAEQLPAVTVSTTFNGTWDASLAADTEVNIISSSDPNPAIGREGKARVVIQYIKV